VVNTAYWENVRHRLERDDFVTFLLLRIERSGALTFAGCHEQILLWRARSGTCERITPDGVWIGITDDIRTLTSDVNLSLEPGDLIVLYTDGITEAMNSKREQFGVGRLTSTVDDHCTESADKVCSAIFESVSNWSADQVDDMTAIVIRYQGG
jgi:serine phosphatase RsbU (regulator of sigma subunit)